MSRRIIGEEVAFERDAAEVVGPPENIESIRLNSERSANKSNPKTHPQKPRAGHPTFIYTPSAILQVLSSPAALCHPIQFSAKATRQ